MWRYLVVATSIALVACGAQDENLHPNEPVAQPDPKKAQQEAGERERQASIARDERRKAILAKLRPVTGECTDEAQIDADLAAMSDVTPEERENASREARSISHAKRWDRWKIVADDVSKTMRAKLDLKGGGDDLDAASAEVAAARAKLKTLSCPSGDSWDGGRLTADFETWATPIESKLAEEKRCRADEECSANRAARPLCAALENKKMHSAQMAKERANPSGVVNKSYLNELGHAIQSDDDEIAQGRASYARATKKPFSEARCAKPKP